MTDDFLAATNASLQAELHDLQQRNRMLAGLVGEFMDWLEGSPADRSSLAARARDALNAEVGRVAPSECEVTA